MVKSVAALRNTSVPKLAGASPRKVALVRLVQSAKAPLPMLVTPLPMVTLVRLVQHRKQSCRCW